MTIFELLIFSLVCAGLAFLGHLVSPRYGWLLGAVLAVPVLTLMFIGAIRQLFRESVNAVRNRSKGGKP